jgi:transcriptional regulator with XRE-family HTH domain
MNKPFNLWLRDEIAARGHTQREFANKLDIDESNVSNYILGKRIPNTRTLIKIVLVLHDGGHQSKLVRLLMDSLQGIENMGPR